MTQPRKSGAHPHRPAFRAAARVTAIFVLATVVLEIVGRVAGIRPDLVPTPSRVLLEIWRDRIELGWQTWVTLSELGGGMLIAAVTALSLAIAGALAPGFRRGALLVMRSACSMPLPAIAPIALVWFGYGRMPKVLVAAFLGSMWVALRWLEGMNGLDASRIDLMRTMGAGELRLLWMLKLPATVPELMSGLRAGTSNALIGVVIGEFVAGDTGMGPIVVSALFRMNTPQLSAGLAILLTLGLLLQVALKSVETIALTRLGIPAPIWSGSLPGRRGKQ